MAPIIACEHTSKKEKVGLVKYSSIWKQNVHVLPFWPKKKKKNREQKSHAKLFSTGLCTLSKDYELNKFQI